MTEERTIVRLWRDATSADRLAPAYLIETEPGAWREVSWPEAARTVHELANGLLARGVRKGDAFGLLSRTRLEWTLFDFALALVGGVTAPVYPNSSAREATYVLEHSEAVGVLIEDEEQRAKVSSLALEHVLTVDELDGLRAEGIAYAATHPRALEQAGAAVGEDDLYTYIYTSGTTGAPKACMIRHRNYYAMTACIERIEDLALGEDVMLLYLPLAHNFGRLMHLVAPYVGFTLAHLDDPLRAAEALTAVRPTIFPSVPRVFEKVHAAVVAQIETAPGPRRRIAEWALKVGYEVSALRQADKPVPPGLALRHRVADRLLYSKVKNRLGGHLRLGLSGGAPLAKEIIEFFHALDILILEAYGLTECTSGATSNRLDAYRFGSVGRALPGTELRIAEDGELLIRSETVFSGYFKDPEATREVLSEDGWLRSGDIAAIDTEGYVTITDRKKDILVTAGGKNVAPQNIENLLKLSPLVSQALVVGDRRPYIAALITLDQAADAADAEKRVGEAVEAANAELSRFEQVKRFRILARDFSADEGEITPTLKLKRRVIEQHFAAEIDELYS